MAEETSGTMARLAPELCWSLLSGSEVGRLAVSTGGDIDIFPVTYIVDGRSIVFRTAEGTKFAAVMIGPRVAFESDGFDPDSGLAWSVVLKGRAEEIDLVEDLPDHAFATLVPWMGGRKDRFVRVLPSRISGRQFRVAPR